MHSATCSCDVCILKQTFIVAPTSVVGTDTKDSVKLSPEMQALYDAMCAEEE